MKYLVTLNGNEYEVEVGADSVTLTAERIGAAKAAPAPAPVSRPAPTAAPHPLPPLSRHPHRLLYPHPAAPGSRQRDNRCGSDARQYPQGDG